MRLATPDLEHPHPFPSFPSEKKSRQKLTLASVRLRHPSKSRQNCVPEEKGHNYEDRGREATPARGRTKDVRLASGSWPADSAIKRSYTSASRSRHVQRPRDLELVVILRSTGLVQRNERAKQKERKMLRHNALCFPLSLSLSLSLSLFFFGDKEERDTVR